MTKLVAIVADAASATAALEAGADLLQLAPGAPADLAPQVPGPWIESTPIDARPGHAPLDMTGLAATTRARREVGLPVILGGALEAPDLPRLLLLAPDMIALSSGLRLARALIPREAAATPIDKLADTVFVHDFVLPVRIGAYASEHAAAQRVRFDVDVTLAPLDHEPRGMADVFSYDVITDGIRLLVQAGHVQLVETLAERIATLLLAQPRVRAVAVRLQKLELQPGTIGIEIRRRTSPATLI